MHSHSCFEVIFIPFYFIYFIYHQLETLQSQSHCFIKEKFHIKSCVSEIYIVVSECDEHLSQKQTFMKFLSPCGHQY